MRRRSGFTLVELMVAMALIIFVMAILSTAFVASVRGFNEVKAYGDLNQKLRAAVVALRADLAADHFEDSKRLSDENFWKDGPPEKGFFRVYNGSPASNSGPRNWLEGQDVEGVASFRSTDHAVHFTARLHGNTPDDFFRAELPPGSPLLQPFAQLPGRVNPTGMDARFMVAGTNTYAFQWAEIAYFLRPITGETANGTQLYGLYRNVRLLTPGQDYLNGTPSASDHPEISIGPYASPARCNSPATVTVPENRYGGMLSDYSNEEATYGNRNLLVQDVVSFDVRVMVRTGLPNSTTTSGFIDLFDSQLSSFNRHNSNFNQSSSPLVFDSWSRHKDRFDDYSHWSPFDSATPAGKRIPMYDNINTNPIHIRAVQVQLRVWDPKTQQSRQVTIVQDL